MKTPIISANGSRSDKYFNIDKELNVEIKSHQLLKDVYISNLANLRRNLAITKTRAKVRGGGKKPWRQKGLGRARFGSTRNPIWRGGGVAFGPTGEENYQKRINKKAKKIAFRQALNLAFDQNKIFIITKLDLKEPKTKSIQKLISKLNLRTPIIIGEDKFNSNLLLASRNIPNLFVKLQNQISLNDLMDANSILLTESAANKLKESLAQGVHK
ncbi:MAG: 50S ribosomal protein L4 [Patescibacteria group bacterium]|jgi:large subunit ribosomal protein L4|nr:50S ribosomal protein L4 [Patescibacteria group bacterium]